MKFLALVVIGLAASSAAGLAQSAEQVGWAPPSGLRIRLVSPTLGERQSGTLISADHDSVVFRSAKFASRVAVRTSDVSRMEVTRRTHRNVLKGALLGFVVAAAVAGGSTAVTWKESNTGFIDFGRWGDAALVGGTIGVLGAAVGALVGSVPRDSWESVPVPRN